MNTSLPNLKRPTRANISPEEYLLIQQLRERNPSQQTIQPPLTWGDRLSDRVVETIGSWKFIVIQSSILLVWIICNILGTLSHWDPYPFILLNLMLSFQAAYTAPIIMMSQSRQAQIDRQDAKHDYEINLKSELEIELLHDKMTLLREEEIVEILQLLKAQQLQIQQLQKQQELPTVLSLIQAQQTQIDRLEQKLDTFLSQSS